jgi:hypothetical protein
MMWGEHSECQCFGGRLWTNALFNFSQKASFITAENVLVSENHHLFGVGANLNETGGKRHKTFLENKSKWTKPNTYTHIRTSIHTYTHTHTTNSNVTDETKTVKADGSKLKFEGWLVSSPISGQNVDTLLPYT